MQNLTHLLEAHGCGLCGSIPIFPDDNDIKAHGELTFNIVDDCHPSYTSTDCNTGC
jgi:hypothetical protein